MASFYGTELVELSGRLNEVGLEEDEPQSEELSAYRKGLSTDDGGLMTSELEAVGIDNGIPNEQGGNNTASREELDYPKSLIEELNDHQTDPLLHAYCVEFTAHETNKEDKDSVAKENHDFTNEAAVKTAENELDTTSHGLSEGVSTNVKSLTSTEEKHATELRKQSNVGKQQTCHISYRARRKPVTYYLQLIVAYLFFSYGLLPSNQAHAAVPWNTTFMDLLNEYMSIPHGAQPYHNAANESDPVSLSLYVEDIPLSNVQDLNSYSEGLERISGQERMDNLCFLRVRPLVEQEPSVGGRQESIVEPDQSVTTYDTNNELLGTTIQQRSSPPGLTDLSMEKDPDRSPLRPDRRGSPDVRTVARGERENGMLERGQTDSERQRKQQQQRRREGDALHPLTRPRDPNRDGLSVSETQGDINRNHEPDKDVDDVGDVPDYTDNVDPFPPDREDVPTEDISDEELKSFSSCFDTG